MISTDGEVSIDGLVKQIEKISALSEADIWGIIIALEHAVQGNLVTVKLSDWISRGIYIQASAAIVPKPQKNL